MNENRKQLIREAAKRAAAPKPEGRWVSLETYTNEKPKKIYKARGGRRQPGSVKWGVLVAGQPRIGQAIGVRRNNGAVDRVYVKAVVIPADRRSDGKSLVTVSNDPVAPVEVVHGIGVEDAKVGRQVFRAAVRNPRICEACEGPCRPGAGMCDGCKRSTRRVAEAIHLKQRPEPEDAI